MESRWRILVVVSVAVFMASLDLFIVNIAFPEIRAEFAGTTVGELSWVLNAYAIVFAALLVPAGRAADRWGRRRGFLWGLVLFLAGSALSGIAPSVETLVAARVLQAAGGALLIPTSLGLLLPEFPPKERATAIGIWAATGGVAAAAGPPIGGLLVEGGWRLVFLVNLPIGIVAGVYALRLLRESRDPSPGRLPDIAGAGVLAVAIGLLALGLVKAPEWGWGDTGTLASLGVAVVLVGAFLRRSARHPSPVIDMEMLRVRSFAMANASAVLFSAAFGAMLFASVLFITEVWGDSILRAGLQVAPGPLMAAVFAVPAGRLADRLGQRMIAGPGQLIFAAGAGWWLWQLDAGASYAGGMLPGLLLTGVGVGLTLSTLFSAAAASLPPARFATGTAVLTMSRQLGLVLGIALFVAVLGTPSPAELDAAFDGGFLIMVVGSALGGLAAFAIGPVGVPAAVAARPATA